MSRQKIILKVYKHQALMEEYNKCMGRVKMYLLKSPKDSDDIPGYPKPTIQEIDSLMDRVFMVLKENNEPMIKK